MLTPAIGPEHLFERLVDITLPNGGYVMALYEVYFDESGCDDGSTVMAVGGYMLRSDRAKEMDRLWKAALDRYDLPYFHMVDCAHGNPPFDRLSKDDRIKIAKRMINLIKRFVGIGFVAVINPVRFQRVMLKPDPYTFCLEFCVIGSLAWLSDKEPAKAAFFFESGHENGTLAHEYLTRFKTHPDPEFGHIYASHTFAKKADVRLLQAADILVWQAAKFIKDKVSRIRPPRKDFESLMKGPHAFAYTAIQNNRIAFSVDNSPLSSNEMRDAYLDAMFASDAAGIRLLESFHTLFEESPLTK